MLALVTWAQRDDPHWFGARIPDRPQRVEFVQVAGSGGTPGYQRFPAAGLAADENPAQRTSFMLGLQPAQLP